MRRWISVVACFYPRQWREEFGPEFEALLEDVKPSWRVFRNVLGGAIRMQITEGGNWMKMAGAMAVLGALVAFAISFRVAPQYVSSAMVSMAPQADPVRRTSPEALHQRAAQSFARMEAQVLSRSNLAGIIKDPSLDLYAEERRRTLFEDVIEEMRRNIHIEVHPSASGDLAPIVFSISFSYPDQNKAQAVVRLLASKFATQSAVDNRMRADAYQGFWGDWKTQFGKSAPPPPVGEAVGVLSQASAPTEASAPNRLVFLGWGLGAGQLLGLFAAFALPRPHGVRRLCGWALAGGVMACAVSFAIPNRFTSAATMVIAPALLADDPMAPLPPATPAAEYLRHAEPDILGAQSLTTIILDRRLNLYPEERAKMPIEEVVKEMARDLSIIPVNLTFEPASAVSAFRISFTYPDRYKAQQVVNAVMNLFEEQHSNKLRSDAPHMSTALRQITERRAGEVLEVWDPASLPVAPVSPNRRVIAVTGMGVGLLIGMIRLLGNKAVAAIPQIA